MTVPMGATETATRAGDVAELFELLERASRLLDRMWHESRTLQSTQLWIQFGEASHSLHRTLLALQPRE